MANNRAFDSLDSKTLYLPWSPETAPLAEEQVLVDGLNTFTTWGGTVQNRLGTTTLGSTIAITVRPDRLWFYQTVETNPVTFVVGSFKNGSVWELRYQQLAPVAGNWTAVTAKRGCQNSFYPHEGVVVKGKLYIKGFPNSTDDPSKLGSIVLDGTGGTMVTRLWGSFGPTVPAALTPPTGIAISAATNANPVEFTTASNHGYSSGKVLTLRGFTGSWTPANGTFTITVTAVNKFTIPVNSTGFGALAGTPVIGWPVSAHAHDVRDSWLYVYTYVQASGHETGRSPLETNPDKPPSSSGPFSNTIPTMVLTNPASITDHPQIRVYRSTDGGGTFYFLQEINSTSDATIVFQDTYNESGVSGGTLLDPVPDANLDTSQIAPTQTSNEPPPTVAPPGVTGVSGIARCTKLVYHQNRIWYGVDDALYYSANEELTAGIPEESFPSGVRNPNFFRTRSKVLMLESSPRGLIVVLRNGTLRIPGTNKASFIPVDFLNGTPGIGGANGQLRASCQAGDAVAWITQDYRLVLTSGDDYAVVTNPIGDVFRTRVKAGADLELISWAQDDKDWIIVMAHHPTNSALTRWYIYDLGLSRKLKTDFWHTPWAVISSAAAVGQSSETDTENKLAVVLWNGTNAQLAYLLQDDTVRSDPTPGNVATTVGYTGYVTTALHGVPLGNHVNQRREPFLSSTFCGISLDRTRVTGDVDPVVTGWIDDFQSTPLSFGTPTESPTRTESKWYKTLVYTGTETWRDSRHAAVKVAFTDDKKFFELHRLSFHWLPESGL